MSVFMFVIAGLFFLFWMKDVIPSTVSGLAPASVMQFGLLTNPVHVLDLSVFLPALVLAGLFLLRRRPWGFVFAPALVIFTVFMALAIAGMVIAMVATGYAADPLLTAIFALISLAGTAVVFLFLRQLRKRP